MNADRNLLFGIVAHQMDFITRDQLVQAIHDWVLDKSKPLGEVLVANGAMEVKRRDLLEQMVDQHVEVHDRDPEKSLASVSSIGSLRDELEQIESPDVTRSLGRVASAGTDDDPNRTRTFSVGASTSGGTRFQILRPHAKGGLGQVSVALDEELKREVALKEIQEHHADHPESRSRFTLEAEITGGLEHPGIVPVYGLGQYADGRPFYAMRFIRGDSLKDAVEAFHRRGDCDSLELRKLLGRFIDVCNAIQYAHSRGVLHRDLKPGNIMLGKYGETLVVDWGLAKLLGKSDESIDEQTLMPSSGSGSAPTQMGSAIGTPAYMSPEQAEGRLDDLGPASDVYSLGATLYTVLTGKPPFSGPDLGNILERVQKGSFPRPRQECRQVPTALEAICLKAMGTRIEDRYQTPSGIAKDLELWLGDESVSAYAEPFAPRMRRWVKRHQSIAAVTAATVLLSTIGLVILFAVVSTKNADLDEKNSALFDANAILDQQKAELTKRNTALSDQLRIATALQLAGQSQVVGNELPIQSLLVAIEGVEATRRYEGEILPLAHQSLRDSMDRVGGYPLVGHESRIMSMEMSSDSHWLATLSLDQTVRLWDLTSADPSASSVVLKGHASELTSVAISPDGRWLVSGSKDKTARVWSLTSDEPSSSSVVLKGHESSVTALSIGQDGRWLVTGSEDKTARLWDLSDPQKLPRVLRGHESILNSVKISPDGRWLATGSSDMTARLWNLQSKDPVASSIVLKGHESSVHSLAVSSDSRWLATQDDKTTRLWDLTSNDPTSSAIVLKGHGSSLLSVAISSDSHWVLTTALHDMAAKLWDLTSENPSESPVVLRGNESYVRTGVISSDSQWAVTGSDDKTVRLWDLTPGAVSPPVVLRGHDTGVFALVISPNGKWLASAGLDNSARLWDLTSDASSSSTVLLKSHESSSSALAISRDSRRVATPVDKTVRLWDITSDDPSNTTVVLKGHDSKVTSVALSPDGCWLASGSTDKTARLWDLTSQDPSKSLVLRGHESNVNKISFSPDSHWLLTGGGDSSARLWDLTSETPAVSSVILEGHKAPVITVAISPDSRLAATGSLDKTVRLWKLKSENPAASCVVLRGHHVIGPIVAFSPDCRWVATAGGFDMTARSVDNSVRLWDLEDEGASSVVLRGHDSMITAIAFSPDRRWVATAGGDRTPRLWDLTSPDPSGSSLVLKGHESLAGRIAISPDSRWLATAGFLDNTARLWDLTTKDPSVTSVVLRGHNNAVVSVAFSSNGRWLVTGSFDKTARLWDLTSKNIPASSVVLRGSQTKDHSVQFSPDCRWVICESQSIRLWDLDFDSLLGKAQRLAGRELTALEKTHYLLDEQ